MTKRRDFIKQGVLGTAGIAIGGLGFSSKSYGSIIGSNDRINIAVVGIRGRGQDHISSWCSLIKSHNVRLVTLCDVDESFFAERSKLVTDKPELNLLPNGICVRFLIIRIFMQFPLQHLTTGTLWEPSGLVRQVNMFMLRSHVIIIFQKDEK